MPMDKLTKCQPDTQGACHGAHLDDRTDNHYKMLECGRPFMDDKYDDWHDLLGKLILKNCGIADLFPRLDAEEAHDEISEKMRCAIAPVDEGKVLLTGPYASRNEYHMPGNFLTRPVIAMGSWALLSQRCDPPTGQHNKVFIPQANY